MFSVLCSCEVLNYGKGVKSWIFIMYVMFKQQRELKMIHFCYIRRYHGRNSNRKTK